MTDSPVSLATLIQPTKTVEFDFPECEGMKVSLCFLSRSELLKMKKACSTTKFDRKSHQPIESFDDSKFLDEFVKSAIKGWKGFKYKYLEELLLVDLKANNLDPEDELPFTHENAKLLMQNSDFFDTWVSKTQTELENFTSRK